MKRCERGVGRKQKKEVGAARVSLPVDPSGGFGVGGIFLVTKLCLVTQVHEALLRVSTLRRREWKRVLRFCGLRGWTTHERPEGVRSLIQFSGTVVLRGLETRSRASHVAFPSRSFGNERGEY